LKKVNSSEDDADSIWTARHAWACVKGCGACCVLDKGPDYPPVEEILTDPDEVAVSFPPFPDIDRFHSSTLIYSFLCNQLLKNW